MSVLALVLTTYANWAMVVSVLAGLSVCVVSILDGFFMIWDKLVHGIPIFWVPD